jgi:hypothetical protein
MTASGVTQPDSNRSTTVITAESHSLPFQPAASIFASEFQGTPHGPFGCAEGAHDESSATPEVFLAQRRYEDEAEWDKDEDWVDEDSDDEDDEYEDDDYDDDDDDYDDDYDDEDEEADDYDDDESSEDWDDDYDEDEEEEEDL